MMSNINGFKEFLKAALRDPRNVSTIFPSLKFLGQAMRRQADIESNHSVLELGCGSGALTKYILSVPDRPAQYLGVELDENLVAFLQKAFPDDQFICASADSLKAYVPDSSVDRVVCSLPWTLFPEDLQEAVVKEIVRVLKPGGKFTTFLCIHALSYPGAPRIKNLFTSHFSGFQKAETVAVNLPPANVYVGTKPKHA